MQPGHEYEDANIINPVYMRRLIGHREPESESEQIAERG